MRHGAGPVRSHESANVLSSDIANLSIQGQHKGQRLGCYFCNDVVAPMDVIFFTSIFHIVGFLSLKSPFLSH